MTTPNRNRILALMSVPAALVLLGVGSWGAGRVFHDPSLPSAQVVHASPETLNYACPPGIINPFDLDGKVASPTLWNSAGTIEKKRNFEVLHADTSAKTLPASLGVLGQGGGELRGLSMSSCQLPSTDQWSVLGSSTTGEDLVLTFANPNSSPSVVSVEAFGLNGPLDVKTHQLTVPAHSTQSVLAGGLFPEETALVLHVRADGQGVATWTQSSAMQGETPKGTTTIPAARPREETLLQGVSIQGTSTLRLFVPPSGNSDDANAHVSLSYTSEAGTFNLPGGEMDISTGTVVDVPLNGMTDDRYTLRVRGDRALVAQIVTNTEQEEYAEGSRWAMRSSIAASPALIRAELPSSQRVESMVRESLSATALRATAQEKPSGVSEIHSRLIITPVHSQSGVQLSVGTQTVTVEAGKTLSMDLPSSDSVVLESPSQVAVTLEVEAQTPSGTLRALWPLSADDVEQASAAITIN